MPEGGVDGGQEGVDVRDGVSVCVRDTENHATRDADVVDGVKCYPSVAYQSGVRAPSRRRRDSTAHLMD